MSDDNRSNNVRDRFQPQRWPTDQTNPTPSQVPSVVPGQPLVSRERRESIQRGNIRANNTQSTSYYPAWQQRKHPPVLTEEEKAERAERLSQARDNREYRDLASSMIMDIEVKDASPEDVKRVNELREPPSGEFTYIKFIALSGGCGPELTIQRSLAEMLHAALGQYLGKAS